MLDTHETVIAFLESALPEFTDHAYRYGEPGYSLENGATPLVVFGSYWCRCGTPDDFHGIDTHYPRTFARLESQGVVFEWCDEWIIDSEYDKAYRTVGDSYHWKPSYVVTEDGAMLTPDDDLETWVEWATQDPDAPRCIPGHIYDGVALIRAGFSESGGKFQNGWHPGQDADPAAIAADIRRWQDNDVDVVFILDETSQFYITFTAHWRERQES